MTVTGTSTSTTNMPLYIDFYLLLDNSPSMGVGATPADVTKMVNNTSDQCAFACHDLNDNNNYYKLAKTLASRRGSTSCAPRPRADGHGDRDADLFEPVSDGDLRFWRLGELGRAASPVFAVVKPVERQDRGRQHRSDDRHGQNENNDQDTQFSSLCRRSTARSARPAPAHRLRR